MDLRDKNSPSCQFRLHFFPCSFPAAPRTSSSPAARRLARRPWDFLLTAETLTVVKERRGGEERKTARRTTGVKMQAESPPRRALGPRRVPRAASRL